MCPLLLQDLQTSQVKGAPSSASKETQQVRMYIHVYMYTYIYAYVHMTFIRLKCVPVHPFIHLSVCLPVCLCICVFMIRKCYLFFYVCRCIRGNDPSLVGTILLQLVQSEDKVEMYHRTHFHHDQILQNREGHTEDVMYQ